jgi:hypothetical protein
MRQFTEEKMVNFAQELEHIQRRHEDHLAKYRHYTHHGLALGT